MFQAYVGFDSRMPLAYGVAVKTMKEKASHYINPKPIHLPTLEAEGYYNRPTERRNGLLYDKISEHSMATEFAISRFFIPFMSNYQGWALFCDSDFLFRSDVFRLVDLIDDKYAIMCIKHNYEPDEDLKMDGQEQSRYFRKNWSSFMLINCQHPKNLYLNLHNLNLKTGRDLHRFCWLDDEEIGEIPESWNWLEGHSELNINPDAVHFTRGTPDMAGYEKVPYSDEWFDVAKELKICKLVS